MIVKARHAKAIELDGIVAGSDFTGDRNALVRAPANFYGSVAYAISKGLQPEPPANFNIAKVNIAFPVGKDERFGETGTVSLNLNAETLLITNANMFPWSHLAVNGVDLTPERSFALRLGTLGGTVGSGRLALEYRVAPSELWLNLRMVSLLSLALSTLWLAWTAYERRRRAP